jgi:carbon-monoxide dehydrogenase medium subunit
MKPVAFDYARPATVAEALGMLAGNSGARVLAGGQTLGPMLNLRLAQPALLVDITRIPELAAVSEDGDSVGIGATVTHAAIEDGRIPDPANGFLARVARGIAYRAVRTRGTIGGSLAHADPAADYPATAIAVGAELVAEGPKGKRTIKVDDFFKGLMTTAVGADEILTEVRVPALAANQTAAYMKFPHPASRFAVVGVAAVLTIDGGKCTKASIGITGAGTHAVRAKGVEAALAGKTLDAASIAAAADKAPDGVDVQADLQGSVDYKKHLLKVFAKRAIEAAVAAKK